MSNIKQHTIRLPQDLYDYYSMRSLANRRSLNREIEMVLKTAMERAQSADREAIEKLPSS
jgi:hypothetical protein